MDVEPEPPQPTEPVAPPFLLPPTRSGCVRQFPTQYQDLLPNSQSQVPHLPVVPKPQLKLPLLCHRLFLLNQKNPTFSIYRLILMTLVSFGFVILRIISNYNLFQVTVVFNTCD